MTGTEQGWSTDRVVGLLGEVPLFRGLPGDELRRVAGMVRGTRVEAGDVIFEEGRPGDAFYVIYSGEVELLRGDGRPMGVRRAGDAVGESALLDGGLHTTGARAVESCRLVVVPREAFREVLGPDTLPGRVLTALSRTLAAGAEADGAADRSGTVGADAASRVLQRGLLPRNAPRVSGYDIAAGTTTEEAGLGTTVWDFLELADGRTALVTLYAGPGEVPPAQHLATARGVFRAVAADHGALREVLPRVNAAMAAAAIEGAEQFVECGVLIPSDEGLEWGSAGRVPCGVIRRDGSFEELGSHGPPLGMMEGFQYGSQKVPAGVGDVAFVLSHGSAGLFRGAADLVAQLPGKPAGEVVATLHKALRRAQGEGAEEISVLFVRKH